MFIVLDIFLLILTVVIAVIGIKTKSLRSLPAVLTIIATALILLYMILYGGFDSLYKVLILPRLLFFTALTLSILYGFAAFAVKGKSQKLTAAKIFGALHAVFGAVMTYFYYVVYSGIQAYDYEGAVIPDVWYYSSESLIIGFGIWAVLGLVAGILLITKKQNTDTP